MSAFNIVRFRVKPGMEDRFLEANRKLGRNFEGFIKGHLIKTGDRSFCLIGEWEDMDSIASNRSKMISNLDSFRDLLEDLGNGLGVTDPVSGEAIMDLKPTGATVTQAADQSVESTARH